MSSFYRSARVPQVSRPLSSPGVVLPLAPRSQSVRISSYSICTVSLGSRLSALQQCCHVLASPGLFLRCRLLSSQLGPFNHASEAVYHHHSRGLVLLSFRSLSSPLVEAFPPGVSRCPSSAPIPSFLRRRYGCEAESVPATTHDPNLWGIQRNSLVEVCVHQGFLAVLDLQNLFEPERDLGRCTFEYGVTKREDVRILFHHQHR